MYIYTCVSSNDPLSLGHCPGTLFSRGFTGDVPAVVGHTLSDGYNVVVAGCGGQKSLRDGNAYLQPYPGTKGCWGSDATVPTSVCMTSTLSFVLSAHRGVGYTVVCAWRIS